jgi:hypothetical protein
MLRDWCFGDPRNSGPSPPGPGIDSSARITFHRAELITFLGGVFHYPAFILIQKRQSHGKFVTPPQQVHRAIAAFIKYINYLHY